MKILNNIKELFDETEELFDKAEQSLDIEILPQDPDDVKMSWFSPEIHAMLNLKDQLKSYFRNIAPAKDNKASGMAKWIPIVAIILIVIVGAVLYNMNTETRNVLNDVVNQMGQMQNQINNSLP